ncbi:MAG TPA: M64 family metallopeptidase [Cyclobacteriaceae bacterium]|nr:M64 family metallopeptidase [Cyclobacteriaceae bacterium]HRF35425.1 M64 family metallopeptidase [Cyclobacteriaceae bacterium]
MVLKLFKKIGSHIIKIGLTSSILVFQFKVSAQIFPVDTLLKNGPIEKQINLVFLSDGYQPDEMTKYISDVDYLVNAMFNQTPFKQYKSYFNVFAIKVPSNDSGATHPKTSSDGDCSPVPQLTVNTYFGSTFDYGGIHRLLVPTKSGNIANVVSHNFPMYDQVFIVVNSPYYGGSGGNSATSSTHADSPEVSIHEIGHSFAGLADEYWAGSGYAAEKPNMTQTSNSTTVKWAPWVGTAGVSVYPYDESPTWFRPHQNCKMRYLGYTFCSVCTETFVEKIHTLVNPLLDYEPKTLSLEVEDEALEFSVSYLKPTSNSMNVVWRKNGEMFTVNQESVSVPVSSFSAGETKISVTITDATNLSRSTAHTTNHVYVVEWTVTNANPDPVTSIDVNAEVREYEVSLFPNPVQDNFITSYTLPKQTNVQVMIYDAMGKRVRTLVKANQASGKHQYEYRATEIFPAAGQYTVVFTFDQSAVMSRIIHID